MRHALRGLALIAAAACAGVFAAAGVAAPNGVITPYLQCTDGSETIPAQQEIGIRTDWVTEAPGLASNFIAAQKVEWSIFGVSPELFQGVLASSGTQSFGSHQFWNEIGMTTKTINGVQRKVYEWAYGVGTGFRLAAGQTVNLVYSFEVNHNLNDGGGNLTKAGTVYATTSCLITAV
jgi:hypothetical protein